MGVHVNSYFFSLLPAISMQLTRPNPATAKSTAGPISIPCSATCPWIASALLHGHIFTSEPMMKPARTMRVCLCQRERSQRRNLLKPRMPTSAPDMNTARTANELQNNALSAPADPQSAPILPATEEIACIMY